MTGERGPGGEMVKPTRERNRARSERDAGTAAASGSGTSRVEGPDGSLLAVLDRLTGLLERRDLTELEVEAGGTGLVLRKASALAPTPVAVGAGGAAQPGTELGALPADRPLIRPSVKAPLTGIFYAAPGPGSAPYVQAGGEVAIGQVIGLIEAMKLFNEIKSDLAGRVVKVNAENGKLVKAKQTLIEVEPL